MIHDLASELPVEVGTAAELVSENREITMTKRNKRQAVSVQGDEEVWNCSN